MRSKKLWQNLKKNQFNPREPGFFGINRCEKHFLKIGKNLFEGKFFFSRAANLILMSDALKFEPNSVVY